MEYLILIGVIALGLCIYTLGGGKIFGEKKPPER
jgi:hypothetical protein